MRVRRTSPRWYAVLRGCDRTHLLALLVPVALYDLGLKAASVVMMTESAGVLRTLELIRSDVLFMAGFVILSAGLLLSVRRRNTRRVVLALVHVLSLLVVVVSTVAYQYLRSTGSTLDWSVAAYYLVTLVEVKDVIAGSTPAYARVALAVTLAYVVFGPWFVVRLANVRSVRPLGSARGSRLEAVGLCCGSAGFVALSFWPSGRAPSGRSPSTRLRTSS